MSLEESAFVLLAEMQEGEVEKKVTLLMMMMMMKKKKNKTRSHSKTS